MYFNILNHLFIIHVITKSQGLINFLNVYVDKFPKCLCICMCVWKRREGVGVEGLKNVRKTYEWGGCLLEMYESVQGGSGGRGVKNCQICAYVLFEWLLSQFLVFSYCFVIIWANFYKIRLSIHIEVPKCVL